jgi:hypothetical protein
MTLRTPFTLQALKVKQRQIQAYIKDNYSKILDRQKEIQQVEAELMALQVSQSGIAA